MSNTASLSAAASVNSSSASGAASASFNPTLAGTRFADLVQAVTTAAVVVNIGGVGTLGYLFVKNLDGANYVELSTDGAVFGAGKLFTKLKAGESCLIPAEPGVTYGAKANTANCDCQIIAIEA